MGSTALLLTVALLAAPIHPSAPSTPTVHTALDHTAPADGDTLSAPPDRVELVFTGPIEDAGTVVSLVLPGGSTRELDVRATGEQTPTVSAALPALDPGGYRIEWRVLSPDGHPLEGTFVFYVEGAPEGDGDVGGASSAGEAEELAAVAGDTSAVASSDGDGGGPPVGSALGQAPGPSQGGPTAGGTGLVLIVASAGINLALLGLAGLLAFAAWGPIPPAASTLKASLGLALVASLLLPAEAWLWTGRALGGDPGSGARLEALLGFTSGRAIAVRLGLVWGGLWALAISRRTRLAAILAGIAVAAGALGGHPAATTPALAQPANAVHLLAAAAWAGGLLYIVTERSSSQHARAVHRVSTVALVSVVLIALTGVLQAWLFLDSLSALVGTSYGRLVLAKASGLLILVGFGAVHRLRGIPAMEETGETEGLTRAVRIELAVAGAVVVVAAVLAHVSPAVS